MRIDIWCAFCQTITDPPLLERYRGLLTAEELQQGARYHFAHDRHRYLITRALVRTTLSRYADVPPECWTFIPNPYGRPGISNDDTRARRISFNISHSSELVVLAITQDHDLGVDTEDVLTRSPPLEIADRFFAPEEVATLRALPLDRQPTRFFQHWTLKESYIKARGMGLSLPLDQFAFHFADPGEVRLTTQPQLEDPAEHWRFWQWWLEPSRQHLLALCARHVPGDATRLVLRQTVPLVSDSDLTATLIASSQAAAGAT
jgi:4'-phosphopantetheinyl transferase